MNTFNLLGDIVMDDGDRFVESDVVPAMMIGWLAKQSGDIAININSCGGSVTGGLAIANAIKGYTKGKTTCNILGIAASMASVVACACDEGKMEQGSFMMVHNPFSIALGDADTLRKEADTLDTIKASLMSFYQSKFVGKSTEEISAMMDAETWIPFEEAEAYGLAASAYAPEEGDGYKAAAKVDTRLMFAKAPEAAKAYYAHIEKPVHAGEVLQPRAEYTVPETPAAEAPTDTPEAPAPEAGETPAEETATPQSEASAPVEEAVVDASATPAAEAPKATQNCDWEARYKGLQAAKDKELANLRAQLADAQKAHNTALETLKAENAQTAQALADAQAECKQLRDKVGAVTKDLEAAQAALATSEERYRDHIGVALAPPAAGGSEVASNWRSAYREMRQSKNSK